MKINVLLFGITTDLLEKNSLEIELKTNCSVADFKLEFQNQNPQLSEMTSYAIAVNESYASDEQIINENDVIAVIPPVSGG